MGRNRTKSALLALILSSPSSLLAEPRGIANLDWLAGCWARADAEPGSVEHWLPPAGGTMLGMARTIKGGRTAEFEFLRIVEAPGQPLQLIALPSGQSETTFTEIRLGEREVVFENLAHDFPQRVIYRLTDVTHLVASIEGMSKGRLRGIEFPLEKVACEAALEPQRAAVAAPR